MPSLTAETQTKSFDKVKLIGYVLRPRSNPQNLESTCCWLRQLPIIAECQYQERHVGEASQLNNTFCLTVTWPQRCFNSLHNDVVGDTPT